MGGVSRFLRYLICLAVALFSTAIVSAQVTESKDTLVGIRDHNFIRTLTENGAPENLSKGQIYLLVRIGAAFENITACAGTSEDAVKLANSLQRASGINEVRYAKEDDYTAAFAGHSSGHLFNMSQSWDFDLSSIVQRLKADGWQVFGGVTLGTHVSANVAGSPLHVVRNVQTFPLEAFTQHPVHLETKVGGIPIALIAIVIFGPFFGLVFGFTAGTAIAKNKTIEISARRKLYLKLIRTPTYGLMGLSVVVSLFAIFTRQLTPIVDVWFGTSQEASVIIPLIMPMMLLSVLAIIPMSKVERKLFSTAPDSTDFKPAEAVPITDSPKKPTPVWMIAQVVAGATVSLTVIFTHPSQLVRFIGTIVGYGLMFTAGLLSGYIASRRRKLNPVSESDDPLVQKVMRFAEAAKASVWSVDVLEPRDQIQKVAIFVLNGKLTLSRTALDELSEPALDYGIVSSLSSKTSQMLLPMFAMILVLVSAFVFAMMKIRALLPREQVGSAIFASFGGMFAVEFPFLMWLNRWVRRKQIRASLTLVPNHLAAREYVEKSMAPLTSDLPSKRTEKFRTQALADIDLVANQMGLP